MMSGKLVITGTRIPVLVVLERAHSGEDIPDLARDYQLDQKLIRQALAHIESKAA
ncbi:MAG: DUF433 domain-containing protein [Candidatus Acidiferrales bacterium]